MDNSYQQEIEQIKKLLKENSKGMTVTDIARKIKINRNSVAKYLDIMRISGHVEMITFGPAKVFFPSRRVPITKMLNYTSDLILVFDSNLNITLINDAFLECLNLKREEIVGQDLEETILDIFKNNLELSLAINEALRGKKNEEKIKLIEEENIRLHIKIIPTTFENGKNGVAIIIKPTIQNKKIKSKLSETKQKLRELLETQIE
ncbi:MAG: PAS domain-containing protein [Candidatus Thermoplasmatota archaeon]